MDVMWLKNPFPKLNANESVDLEISGDSFIDDPQQEHNLANTGFYYVRSNNKTISLFDTSKIIGELKWSPHTACWNSWK
ncbi:hypothetical protein GOBAR_AA32807 [Gossypium barbadense]|uniref:Nucleotide-diphospho-sugar transferase domain-containing protein n=1 Tax=Gossypium barbadense TaxID=3634 RepID=A0A2P5WA19_GOSBA|nr:hypothetical protein GOBAR_AA32807 [Gossypium barbadense]